MKKCPCCNSTAISVNDLETITCKKCGYQKMSNKEFKKVYGK